MATSHKHILPTQAYFRTHAVAVFKDGSHRLIYLPREKHLYCHKYDRSGQSEYFCYESMLPKEYKIDDENNLNCNARIMLRDGQCRRNSVVHKSHQYNEIISRDLQTLNAVREKSR